MYISAVPVRRGDAAVVPHYDLSSHYESRYGNIHFTLNQFAFELFCLSQVRNYALSDSKMTILRRQPPSTTTFLTRKQMLC